MRSDLGRRAILLLPFLLVSCGDDDEPPARVRGDFAPLRYGYLPPISLKVERVEMSGDFAPPSGEGEIGGLCPVSPADTLVAMARDRLKPVATGGIATFRVLAASMVKRRDSLKGVLAVRLDVRDADNTDAGYAEARVNRTLTGPTPDLRGALYDMLKSMMDDMNVELEFQLRNKLRPWIVEPPAEPAATPPPPPPAPPPLPPPPLPPPRI